MPQSAALFATPIDALRAAVLEIGGQAATAKLLGVSQPSVWRWVHGKAKLPAECVRPLSAKTNIPAWSFRPDIFPIEQPLPPAPSRAGTLEVAN